MRIARQELEYLGGRIQDWNIMESQKRSVVKAICWRVIATVCTAFAAWFVTGSVQAGISIGIVDFFIKVGIYYGHERLWQRVEWGLHRRIDEVGRGGGI